jgi:cysteinyl-tRNA synthetase
LALMDIRLHNTLTGRKETFEPLQPGRVGIYVCGPTVYDYPHLGHARCYVVYDVLVRHLRESGLQVKYVRNITDIDDKILKRAAEAGEEPAELARRYADIFHQDMERLGVRPADVEPRVSDHLPEIFALVGKLIEKGHAYQVEGDVYFEVSSFLGYGALSRRGSSSLVVGASGRLCEISEKRKRDPADFALWKSAGDGEAGWESPWGRGRPGWHIECSAMSMKHLGETFDIHGGGLDLVFPHHENEIAQSEAATGKKPARFWVHNGFIEVNKEKMSKSLGNFFTSRRCFELLEPEALRYYVLTVHYRAPLTLDFGLDDRGCLRDFPGVEEAERRVEYIYGTRKRLAEIAPSRIVDKPDPVPPELAEFPARLRGALDDDLNTPVALAVVNDFLKCANEMADGTRRKKGKASRAAVNAAVEGFAVLGRVLGLGEQEPEAFLVRVRARRVKAAGMSEEAVEQEIAARNQARKSGDYQEADAIRGRLVQKGIELMDGPEGTTWRVL